MGQTFTYKCTNCNYEVETSGKKDCGFHAVVRPYICNDCKIINDVLIGEYGKVFNKEKLTKDQKDFYKCSNCDGENIVVWDNKKKPCPKCGNKMIKDPKKPIILWD